MPGPQAAPPSVRADAAALSGLLSFTLLTRVFHVERHLHFIDSVNFALAVEEYDVTAMRPHPPGYPVFVALARLVDVLVRDPGVAIHVVAVACAVLAVLLLYLLARQWTGRRAALVAAGLFSLSPVLWYNSLIHLSYTAEAAASVGFALAAWRTRQDPTPRRVAILSVVFGLVLGVRQSLLFYLTPLYAYACLAPPRGGPVLARRILVAAGAGTASVLAWFVPMVLTSTDGLQGWWRASSFVSRYTVFHDTVFTGGSRAFVDHWDRLLLFLTPERPVLMVGFLFLVIFLAQRWQGLALRPWPPGTVRFLACWLLPSLAFFLLIFDGLYTVPSGYVLVFLPGIYVATACLGDAAIRAPASLLAPPSVRRLGPAVAVLVLLAPAPALVEPWQATWEREVRGADGWTEGWLGLRSAFHPDETAILTWFSWPTAKWYFPEYKVWNYTPYPGAEGRPPWILTRESKDHADDISLYDGYLRGPVAPAHPVPEGTRFIVLMDFQLAGENGGSRRLVDGATVRETFFPNGWRALVVDHDPTRATIESYYKAPADVSGFA